MPVGGYVQSNPQIRVTVGGNPDLQPETSTSTNLGLDYRPSWADGLELSLDWWRIRLENTIRTDSASQVLHGCILNGSPALCDRIRRYGSGDISTLNATNNNFGSSQVEGYDFALGYRLPETSLGRFSLAWHSSYIDRQVHDLDGDGRFGEDIYEIPRIGEALNGNEGGNTVGQYNAGRSGSNNWRLRSTLGTRWELGQFGATWNVRYYSSQEEDCQAFEDYGYGYLCSDTDRTRAVAVDANGNGVWDGVGGGDTIINRAQAQHHIGATTYHDVSVFWNAPWNARITIGANNVFDKDPPIARQAAANSFDPQYDVPGRFVYLRYSQTF
ncbi:TonB-dependent receptor [Lysobacter psychrotolerans]|uniref:TonB-dependent receptor n=1 Tax=Montanilutibacter psychrotolerans TaxID=1327343 RepID=A0A3M8STV8_9GAMM|nr:TonB-dependent receptor [Lysobacter psychrotolerans]